MTQVWILLSAVLNICCMRFTHGNKRNIEHLARERRDNVAESDYFSCRWNEPPENAEHFRMCALGECRVTTGNYGQNGTRRITRCNPRYSLVQGNEKDVCHNGEWSSSGHKCVQCGRSPRTFDEGEAAALIIGGQHSSTGDFPWMAAVFTPRISGRWTLICGGTLISPTIVLTAGHCLDTNGHRRKPEDIKVGLGRLSANISTNEPRSIIASAKTLVLPKRFVGPERLYDLDIGLIVLKDRVPLTGLIMPACLDWDGNRKPTQDEIGILAGWGLANVDGFRSENLKWTYQKYIEYQQCQKVMRPTDRRFLSPDKFCADQVKGGETERGDDGGGLTFVRDEVHYVYGVVSTKMIMKAKQLRLYTNVMDEVHRAWLQEEWRKLQVQQQTEDSSALSSFNKMPGCKMDSQCPDNRRCVGQTCLDLCPSACGTNSVCRMVNHLPVCSCPPGYEGNPYDSCKDVNKESSSTDTITDQPECRWLTSSGSAEGELELNDACVATGNPGEITATKQGEFPFLGIIGDEEFRKTHNGVLISQQWFLSTASCYSAENCNKKVKLGITYGNRNFESIPVYDVIEEHLHPDYDAISKHNIGVFKLNTVVRFTQFIRPACLIHQHQLPATKGVVIGKLKGVLSKTTTKLLPEIDCKAITTNFKDESELCVNIYRSTNSLRMFAGYPMVGPIEKPYCMYGLLGLATFGITGQPEGYMRLSYYLSWIENIVRPQSKG